MASSTSPMVARARTAPATTIAFRDAATTGRLAVGARTATTPPPRKGSGSVIPRSRSRAGATLTGSARRRSGPRRASSPAARRSAVATLTCDADCSVSGSPRTRRAAARSPAAARWSARSAEAPLRRRRDPVDLGRTDRRCPSPAWPTVKHTVRVVEEGQPIAELLDDSALRTMRAGTRSHLFTTMTTARPASWA